MLYFELHTMFYFELHTRITVRTWHNHTQFDRPPNRLNELVDKFFQNVLQEISPDSRDDSESTFC